MPSTNDGQRHAIRSTSSLEVPRSTPPPPAVDSTTSVPVGAVTEGGSAPHQKEPNTPPDTPPEPEQDITRSVGELLGGMGWVPDRDADEVAGADPEQVGTARHFVEALPGLYPLVPALTDSGRGKLLRAIVGALGRGVSVDQVAMAFMTAPPVGTVDVGAVFAARVRGLVAPAADPVRRKPPHCGDAGCDPRTRQRVNDGGVVVRCPACHPLVAVG